MAASPCAVKLLCGVTISSKPDDIKSTYPATKETSATLNCQVNNQHLIFGVKTAVSRAPRRIR